MKIVKTQFEYKQRPKPLQPLSVKYFMLHHIKAVTATPEEIHAWHLDRGFWGAGYNAYVRKSGTIYLLRDDLEGAHCKHLNSFAYGIGLEGDYETETGMPDEQYYSLVEYIKHLKKNKYPYAEVTDHGRHYDTDCPGKYFPLAKINIGVNMPLLRVGAKGDGVTLLQVILQRKGFTIMASGLFDTEVERVVRLYQSSFDLHVDGLVGPLTWTSLLNS